MNQKETSRHIIKLNEEMGQCVADIAWLKRLAIVQIGALGAIILLILQLIGT